jgi:Do/DeqQ family serine protease
MSSRVLPSCLFFAACVAVVSAATGRSDRKAGPVAQKQRPAVQVDRTPIEAGPGVVLSYADVVEPVQRAVVSIYSTKVVRERIRMNPLFRQLFPDLPHTEREREERGLGSGVIVSPDGYILTNNHVIEGADELKVALADGREYIAEIIGSDPKTDVAVVKIEADSLPVVTLADSDRIRVGDVVFAIGNPLGVGQTVTMGIVSAKGRSVGILGDIGGYEDYIQTDAAINMGNSGGALVDAKGRLIGVNSAILSPSRVNIGIGFAIPIKLASWIMNSLVETGTVARGYLGVSAEPLTADIAEQLELPRDTRGVVITDLIPDKAAEKAGLKRTDVILAIDDHPVTTVDELRLLVAQMMPGSIVRVKLVRDGRPQTIEVKLDRFDDRPDELVSGVDVRPLTAEDRRRAGIADPRIQGLLVTQVAEDSPYRDQLAPGAVIMEIDRQPVADLATARALLQPGRNLVALYYRGAVRYLVLNLR